MVGKTKEENADKAIREQLILLVKARPVIWDVTNSNHKYGNRVDNAWANLYKELVENFTQEKLNEHEMGSLKEAKKIWQYLRNQYRKEKRRDHSHNAVDKLISDGKIVFTNFQVSQMWLALIL